MNFRMAEINDLQEIKKVYNNIIADMDNKGISIWDEVYPCEFFEGDIGNNNLYAMFDDNGCMVSAFAIISGNDGDDKVKWKSSSEHPLYIDRFGVNPHYAGKGVGKAMLKKAAEIAKERGADSLRLFVVDINTPAVSLYEKAGFIKADGVYYEKIDEKLILAEYGYEYAVE